MDTLFFVFGIPLAGSVILAFTGHREFARDVNVAFSLGTFIAACILTAEVISLGPIFAGNRAFFIDPLNVFLVTLTAFVGLTTAIFSRPYMRVERDNGKMTPPRLRLYHSMYQLFSFTMLLALTTNNMGILWVAMEAATLTTVLLVSVYRTAASLEAAWKYFILCGVGIAQALFGTVLLYMAAEKVVGPEGGALLWTNLEAVKGQLDPTIITLAFAFLFIGYATKVGLVPLHNWLPDAHAEGPTPVSAVLSGLLLNVALYAILRCKVLTDGALASALTGQLMMGFGLLSVLVAAFFISRQKDVKRMFAYSSIEHMGPSYDRPFVDQIGHLLRGRSRDPESGHADHGGHSRPHQSQSNGRLGNDVGFAGDPRHAPVWRLRERVPHSHYCHARAALGHAFAAARSGGGLCLDARPGPAHGVRRNLGQASAASACGDPRICPSWTGLDAGSVYSAISGCLVSSSGADDRRLKRCAFPD